VAILFVSNGHGEDALAAVLAHELANQTKEEIIALPLVGEGIAYQNLGIKIIHHQELLPSGGFAYLGWTNMKADLNSGLLKQIKEQKKVLKSLKDISLAVCVGDSYNLYLVSRNLNKDIVFIPTAKSNYIKPHLFLEILLMRRKALIVLPRDEVTAIDLREKKVNAKYVGNLMMDAIYPTGYSFPVPNPIGILPGTRQDAAINLQSILKIIEKTTVRDHYLVAVANSFNVNDFIAKSGWDKGNCEFASALLKKGSKHVYLCQGMFGDIIKEVDIVLGLSGTGNEQAAGLGKPVVTFVGPGTQFNAYFARKQNKLLGDAVVLVEGNEEAVAKTIDKLSLNPDECKRRGAIGKERMGVSGAKKRMADLITAIINKEVIS